MANSSRMLRALAFADALDDPLLGGLHGGAAEDGEVDRLFHDVAGLEAVVEGLGVVDRDLVARVLDDGDDGLEQDDADVALAVVDVDFGLHVWTVLLGEGGENAVLEQCVQFRAIELLGVRHLAKRGKNLCRTDHPGHLSCMCGSRAEHQRAAADRFRLQVKRQPRLLDGSQRNAALIDPASAPTPRPPIPTLPPLRRSSLRSCLRDPG